MDLVHWIKELLVNFDLSFPSLPINENLPFGTDFSFRQFHFKVKLYLPKVISETVMVLIKNTAACVVFVFLSAAWFSTARMNPKGISFVWCMYIFLFVIYGTNFFTMISKRKMKLIS